MLATALVATEACPGPHEGATPRGEEIASAVAVCGDCGRTSRICPRCSGRSRAGALHCRLCGVELEVGWRAAAWSGLSPGEWTSTAAGSRAFSSIVDTFATPSWVGLVTERDLLLCEPGPSLRLAWQVPRQERELVVDVWPEPEPVPNWRMATSKRTLRLDARADEWVTVEEHGSERGDLYWRDGALRCYSSPAKGASLWLGERHLGVAPSRHPFTPPARIDAQRRLLGSHDTLYLVNVQDGTIEHSIQSPQPIEPRAPSYDSLTRRAYFATSETVWWWKPGVGRPSPFLPAGGAGLAGGTDGVVILEADRIRFHRPDGRRIWDSQLQMPDLALSPVGWDRSGEALLVPLTAARRPVLLLLDLGVGTANPQQLAIDAELVATPRLAPGGIVAVVEESGARSAHDAGRRRSEVRWLMQDGKPSERG